MTNHGHDAGDMVLRAIGAKLQEVMLAGEIPCRFGGEEFMVLVPAAGCSETLALAERLREAVSLTQVRHVDRILPSITISAGIVSYPDHGLQRPICSSAPMRHFMPPSKRGAIACIPARAACTSAMAGMCRARLVAGQKLV